MPFNLEEFAQRRMLRAGRKDAGIDVEIFGRVLQEVDPLQKTGQRPRDDPPVGDARDGFESAFYCLEYSRRLAAGEDTEIQIRVLIQCLMRSRAALP